MKNFDTLFEKELERFQLGGIIVGDRIRFTKDCLKLDYIKSRAASYQDIIRACSEPTFDLNLRVGAVKSVYPTTSHNYTGGVTDAPDGIFLDIYIEYAPGLYRNPKESYIFRPMIEIVFNLSPWVPSFTHKIPSVSANLAII